MSNVTIHPGWTAALRAVRPFGETDLEKVLKHAADALSIVGARVVEGRRTLALYGDVSDHAAIDIELAHVGARLVVAPGPEFADAEAVEALASVIEVALASPDRRGIDSATPLMAPQGNRDRLTDAIDRDGFIDHLEMEFAAGPDKAAVMVLGLDGLGIVNETLGHDAGDAVIAATADRLRDTLRSCDVISRLGGDIFGIYCPNMGVEIASKLAGRLQEAIARPLEVAANTLSVSASAGIAVRGRGEKPQITLENADTALQAAKRTAAGEIAVFDGIIRARTEDRRKLAVELVDALEENQLATAFEPIVHLPNGAVVGVEAHVLWNHPERGEIDRADFMDLAELIGRVDDVERAVLEFAILQNEQRERKVRTGVNLSTSTLRNPHAVQWVVERLGGGDHQVLIEVSESAINAAEPTVVRHLSALREAGASIVLDDFGQSFASLRALHAFTFDGVKLHTGILNEGSRARAAAIVKAVYGSANVAGFDVIHTGVSTDDDLRLLMALGDMTSGEGFYAQGAAVRARVSMSRA